jgi:tRNA G18 (ribose-2'-O)-methylase SpoU
VIQTRVEAADDPRLSPYRNVRDRDARRQGTFVAEGLVVLDAVLDGARHEIESILISDRRLEGAATVLERVPDDVPLYVVDHELMVELVGFDIHRGLLAVGRRAEPESLDSICGDLAEDATILVLEDLTDVDNVGACFRNAACFGAAAVALTGRCADPLYRKAIRVSAGHAVRVPFYRGGGAAALLAELEAAGFHSAALCLDAGAVELADWRRPAGRLAVWLGTEGRGLSSACRDGAGSRVRIAMAPGVDSLNVSVAGALALYQMRAVAR